MKWLIVGDVHGKLKAFNYALNHTKLDYDLVIQLGDFGFWKSCLLHSHKKFKEMCKKPIFFVRGNHEEYSRRHEPFFDDYENVIAPIYFKDCDYIPRHINDEMIDIGGLSVLGVGGAFSIDRSYRKLDESWWRQEMVNAANVERIIHERLRPDIILSHDGPHQFFKAYKRPQLDVMTDNFYGKPGDAQLTLLYNHIKPRYWFFGHHHKLMRWTDKESGTHFIAFPIHDEQIGIFDTEFMDLEITPWW